MQIICINGSPAQPLLKDIKSPAITFFDNELLNLTVNKTKASRSEIVHGKLLKNLDLGVVVTTQSNSFSGGPIDQLEAIWTNRLSTDKKFRKSLCKHLKMQPNLEGSSMGILSTGGFALAFLTFFGAKSISMSGFTFYKSPHKDDSEKFYKISTIEQKFSKNANRDDTRSHSLSDSNLISSLVLMGYKINSNDSDLLPILHNWGV